MSCRALTTLSFDRVEPDQFQGDVFEDSQIVCGMAGAGAHLVIVEHHAHDPVQAIFYRPVGANGVGQCLSVGAQAADV